MPDPGVPMGGALLTYGQADAQCQMCGWGAKYGTIDLAFNHARRHQDANPSHGVRVQMELRYLLDPLTSEQK